MRWESPAKPAEIAENRLLAAILDGTFPIESSLPGERDLAAQIGVTRPTLREALQRLARDGWLDIQQGKPTRVRNYWREGSLAVLAALAQTPHYQTPDFVANLLEVRAQLGPAYTRQACQAAAAPIRAYLQQAVALEGSPAACAAFDWELHSLLTQLAPNPIYRLLLNNFEQLYALMGARYFAYAECRQHSQNFYAALLAALPTGDLDAIETLTRQTMQGSLDLWHQMQGDVT